MLLPPVVAVRAIVHRHGIALCIAYIIGGYAAGRFACPVARGIIAVNDVANAAGFDNAFYLAVNVPINGSDLLQKARRLAQLIF